MERSGFLLVTISMQVIRPTFAVDESAHVGVSKHHSGPQPPCSAEISVSAAGYVAVDEGESAGISHVFPCLSCDHAHALCN